MHCCTFKRPNYITFNKTSATIPYSDTVSLSENGTPSLVNPKTIEITTSNYTSVYNTIKGKYVDTTGLINDTANKDYWSGIFYIPENDGLTYFSGTGYYITSTNGSDTPCRVVADAVVNRHGYVNSPDPNAYPVDDGYTYTALGQLGNKVQMATGSYVGAGTYGANNPNSLTFDFKPKIVFVAGDHKATIYGTQFWCFSYTEDFANTNGYAFPYGFATMNQKEFARLVGNKLEWYSTAGYNHQVNASGTVYDYLAIG